MAESSICMKETLVPGVAMISTVTAIMLEHPSLYFQTSILILLQNVWMNYKKKFKYLKYIKHLKSQVSHCKLYVSERIYPGSFLTSFWIYHKFIRKEVAIAVQWILSDIIFNLLMDVDSLYQSFFWTTSGFFYEKSMFSSWLFSSISMKLSACLARKKKVGFIFRFYIRSCNIYTDFLRWCC